jgi:RNase adapter protein RapZ
MTSNHQLHIVLLTGLSGAGKTLALKTLEDLEYFAIDNLPSSLLDPLILLLEQQNEIIRVALVMDGRDRAFLSKAKEILESLRSRHHQVTFLFLDAAREILIRRFAETRRPHPLARNETIETGVDREIKLLEPLKQLASRVITTSAFTVHDLRRTIIATAAESPDDTLQVFVSSFGFKYGVPLEAAFIFDVRYLPNPFFVKELRVLNGLDQKVSEYVFADPESGVILTRIVEFMETVLPLVRKEGRSSMLIAIGCTGGQHRSVALAEEIGRQLEEKGLELTVTHRDLPRSVGQQLPD